MRLFIFKLFLLFALTRAQAIEIPVITCELAENPVGITTQRPRFGWQLTSTILGDKQTAYEIMVSSSKESLARDQGESWQSTRVNSSSSQFIRYNGKPLVPGVRYYWRVRIWDVKGKMSSWSKIGFWEMAPDLSTGVNWIGAITKQDSKLPEGRSYHVPSLKNKDVAAMRNAIDTLAMRSILLRKFFRISKPVKNATIYVSGLGHYELLVNGKKVGNSEFAPHWSDYDKTVYYNTYHIDSLLTKGPNAIGVILGNGFYNVTGTRYRKLWVSFGPPTLFFQMRLQYQDGSTEVIRSDASWKWSESPITFNCIYGGEDYDATLEQPGWNEPVFNDTHWKPVVIQDAPKGRLRPQLAPPVKMMKQYEVKRHTEPAPGIHVLDMGQNLSGYPTIKVQGKRGQTIKLMVGELLTSEGLVNQKRSGAPHYYEYTLRGDKTEEWHPRFSYYGFQYIQIEGGHYRSNTTGVDAPVVLDVKSNFIYNSAGETGTFECSNELFNQAHLLINNAVKSNWQSVFTDCPHREKLGWIEEVHLNGPGLLSTYNLRQFIPKVMQDMADSQRPDGLVPSIAPEYVMFGGDFSDSPEWGVASVVLPWMYYEYYGDTTLIRDYYPTMKRYVDYLTTKSENFIVSHGLGDWYDYGEHAAGYSKNSPIALSATAHFYFGAQLVYKAAALLGNKDDVEKCLKLGNAIRQSYNEKFFNRENKQYGTGSQYSNAVSLFLDLVDPQYKQNVLDNLVADIRAHGNRLTTGDVGNRYLYQVLAMNGYNDVMYKMHNHDEPPGYGFQIKFGLTTLTEQWDPRKGNSWNHFMMGQIDEWFYTSLAGIKPDIARPGFKHVRISPDPVGDMKYAKSTVNTLFGDVKVHWTRDNGTFIITADIPVNTTATILLPKEISTDITVNDVAVKKYKHVTVVNPNAPQTELLVGSGQYRVACKLMK